MVNSITDIIFKCKYIHKNKTWVLVQFLFGLFKIFNLFSINEQGKASNISSFKYILSKNPQTLISSMVTLHIKVEAANT